MWEVHPITRIETQDPVEIGKTSRVPNNVALPKAIVASRLCTLNVAALLRNEGSTGRTKSTRPGRRKLSKAARERITSRPSARDGPKSERRRDDLSFLPHALIHPWHWGYVLVDRTNAMNQIMALT